MFKRISHKSTYKRAVFRFVSVAIFTFSPLTQFFTPTIVDAAPVTGFKAGRIIDESVMANKSTMSITQIQSFLNGQVPTCDTAGTQLSEYGGPDLNSDGRVQRWEWGQANYGQSTFTCLRDYIDGGKSSAQIIYEVAQEFSINPQVLIVLLQKEQGLVNDTWPLNVQYRSATGYGCPDTAPCDSQYYGLTNQIRWAATMFRAIMNSSPTWYTPYVLGNNFIQYSPNASCGGSTVNIENRATQALYNYTPYQPNQAALQAGWGTADCGAYGNRNFYLYFTNWFGPTNKPALPSCTTTGIECVYEFLNEDTQKSFYTKNSTERNEVYKQNYTFIGIAFHSRPSTDTKAIPVYRLYNTQQGFHLWTVSLSERSTLDATDEWSDEGIVFYMDPADTNSGPSVKRLYTQNGTGRHILSSNLTIVKQLLAAGYVDEGTAFRTPSLRTTPPIASEGKLNVYRFHKGGKHFWTTSLTERETLIDQGHTYEGVSWETPNNGAVPVYRVYSPTGYHFWTKNVAERNQLVAAGWRNEGTAWTSLTSGTATMRLYNTKTGKHMFTTSIPEKTTLLSSSGWVDEGIAWYQ